MANYRKLSVLFLCSHNSARSQMAEALLRHYGGDRFEVYSAGLEPSQINPFTIKVIEEMGLTTEGQYAKNLLDYFGGKFHFTYLITVCSSAEEKCPIFPFATHRLYWPFPDPSAAQGSDDEKTKVFREVRDEIAKQVRTWLKQLEQQNILPSTVATH